MISCEPAPVGVKVSETVNISTANSSVQSSNDAVDEFHVDEPKAVHYRKRLHTVAENVEKLYTYYKKIENKNHKQKELIASVLQDFDKFSEKLETISAKTTKVKETFEENKRFEVPKRNSSYKLIQKKSHKKRNSPRLHIKAYVLEDSMKEKIEQHLVKKIKDNPKKLTFERKENQYCRRMHGDTIGDSDNKSPLTCPDTIVTEIKDLRKIFNTLKKSVETNSTAMKNEETIPSKNNATMVETISSLISEKILKILNKMLNEDFEQIKKDIDAIDSNWKLDASSQRENIRKRQCDAWMMKAVNQIENIQNQVEQISQTNKLLNDEMLRQKENIISLDGRINEINLPKQIRNLEASKKGEWYFPGDQCHGNPDFWIAKLLRSVENLADQLKSEKMSLDQKDKTAIKFMEANMKESVNKEEYSVVNPSKIHAPMNDTIDIEFPREIMLNKRKRSSTHLTSDNSTCSSETKKTPCQKVSSIRRMKRYGYSQQIYNGAKANSTGQLEYSHRPTRIETLSLRRPTKFSNTANNNKKQPERSSSLRTKSFSPLLAPLFAADPNLISDLIAKEVERRIPELIRINKIPKLLDEIAYQAVNRYHAASGEVPFTVTRGKLTQQTPRINIRYLEIKKKSSLTRKNIFKNAHEANEHKKHNGLPNNQSRKRASSDDSRRRKGASSGDSQRRALENQSLRNSENSTSRAIDQAREQRKLSYPNLHWKKENLELYSKEFLAAIKRSFVEIISNEIKNSVTGLVNKGTSPVTEKKKSSELKVNSASSLKPMWGSGSRELMKNNLPSEQSINKTDQLHSPHNFASRTAITSQITLDCVQKFVAAIKTENIQRSVLPDNEKSCMDKTEEKGQVSKPTECQVENFRQGSNIQPNLFVTLPGIQILDSFWSGQILGPNLLPAEEMKTSTCGESSCCECISKQNCQQPPLSTETDIKNCSDTSTCKCSFEFSTSSCD